MLRQSTGRNGVLDVGVRSVVVGAGADGMYIIVCILRVVGEGLWYEWLMRGIVARRWLALVEGV